MEPKPVIIDILGRIPPKTRVILNEDFRTKLFSNVIRECGTKRELSKTIGVNETSIYEWKSGRKRPPLDKLFECGEIAHIDNHTIAKNVSGITSYLYAGRISVKNLRLFLNAELAEWLGLLRGDGGNIKILHIFIK